MHKKGNKARARVIPDFRKIFSRSAGRNGEEIHDFLSLFQDRFLPLSRKERYSLCPMDLLDILLRLGLGLGIGFCIGMTGVGGGVLVIPALTLLLDLKASIAVGTGSLYAALTKMYATWKHFRLKTIEFKPAWIFLTGALPADIVVSYAINQYLKNNQNQTEMIAQFENNLKLFMGLIIILSTTFLSVNLLLKSRKKSSAQQKTAKKKLSYSLPRMVSLVILGAMVGALIGSTSIGGGILIIPVLILIFGMRTERSVGTSIFIAVVLTLATALIYGKGAQLDGATAGFMALGSLLGVHWGSALAVKLPEKILQAILIFLIFTAAIMMISVTSP